MTASADAGGGDGGLKPSAETAAPVMSHWAEDSGGGSGWKPPGAQPAGDGKSEEEKKEQKPEDSSGDGDEGDAGGAGDDGGGDAGGGEGGGEGGASVDAGGGGGGGGGAEEAASAAPGESAGAEKAEAGEAGGGDGGAEGAAAGGGEAAAPGAAGAMGAVESAAAAPGAAPAAAGGAGGGAEGAAAEAGGAAPAADEKEQEKGDGKAKEAGDSEAKADKAEGAGSDKADAKDKAADKAAEAPPAAKQETEAAAKDKEGSAPGAKAGEAGATAKKALKEHAAAVRAHEMPSHAKEHAETAVKGAGKQPEKEAPEGAKAAGAPAAEGAKKEAEPGKEKEHEQEAHDEKPAAAPGQKGKPEAHAEGGAKAPSKEAPVAKAAEPAAEGGAKAAQKGAPGAKAEPGAEEAEAAGGEGGGAAGGGGGAEGKAAGGAEGKAAGGAEAKGGAAPAGAKAKGGGAAGGGGSGKAKAGGGSGTVATDPGFQSVKGRISGTSKSAAEHPSAQTKADEAQAAAEAPGNDVEAQAQGKHVGEMANEPPQSFNRAAFLSALREKIAAAAPKNLQEASDFKGNNQLADVKSSVTEKVQQGKEQAQGNIKKKAAEPPSTAGIQPKPVTPMPPANPGAPPAKVDAGKAMPKAKPEAQVSLKPESQKLDQKMSEADITESQLKKSNEPGFQAAVTAKKGAQEDALARPPVYRGKESGTIAAAQGQAEGVEQAKLGEMQGQRGQMMGQVLGKQGAAKGQDEKARADVTSKVQQIYQNCKGKVEARLSRLDGEVNAAFDQGSGAAKAEFENYVGQRMDAYKARRYSGLLGKGRWLKDKLFGMPSEVNAFYSDGKNRYLASMEATLERVATIVETGLKEAQAELARGKQEVQQYVASLPANLQSVGQQAAQDIQSKFAELEQSIAAKEGELVDALAQKYNESVQQLDASIEEMKAANKGLVDKALDAIGEVWETIKKLKDMLLNVLARVAGVIGKILRDPIGFVGNLVAGAKAGFVQFVSKIGQHLQAGLIGWLTGALGDAGIQMPSSFDLKGIFQLVMQVMGVTYQAIRARAAKFFGEKAVAALEKGSEIFKLLMSGGVAAIWEHIQNQIGDLKEMVIGQIKNFVITKIITAGVTWVLSLLNPASAFIRACKAIYDIVMFFIERAAQIAELVNAVLDSVEAVASGNVSAMANKIEGALAKALPVVISFLASMLGLGGVSTKIRSIIEKVKKPIDKAIDWVLKKAFDLLKKAGGFLKDKFGGGKKKEDAKKITDPAKAKEQQTPGAKTKDKDAPKESAEGLVMAGEAHTIVANPQTAEVIMRSTPERLAKKIGHSIGVMMAKKDRTPEDEEQIAALKSMASQVRGAEKRLNEKTAPAVAKEIAGYVATYGNKYKVPDFGKEGGKNKKDGKPIKVPVQMKGSPHTITVTTGAQAKVEMASQPGLVVTKVDAALQKIQGQTPAPADAGARITDLNAIKAQAQKVQGLATPADPSLDPEIQQLVQLIKAYGTTHKATDIEDCLGASQLTAAELKELETTAKEYAQQIHQKQRDGKKFVEAYRKDPKGFLSGGQKVTTGNLVENVGTEQTEQAAGAARRALRNVYIKCITPNGIEGGAQKEMDFLLVGAHGIEEIVSAKLDIKKASNDNPKLDTYYALKLPPVAAELKAAGFHDAAANTATDVMVFYTLCGNEERMPLQAFRTTFPKTAVSLPVRRLGPKPDVSGPSGGKPDDIVIKITKTNLVEALVAEVNKELVKLGY